MKIRNHAYTHEHVKVMHSYLAGPQYAHLRSTPSMCKFTVNACIDQSQHIARSLASSIVMLS